jgi:hypothetical protein
MLKKIGIGLAIVLLVVALVGFFVVLPLGLLGVGAYRAVKQDRIIRSAVPVDDVRITWSQVKVTSRSRKSTNYKPDIQYAYAVDGRQYTGSAVTPLDDDSSLAWAQEATGRFRLLSRHQGWHAAGDPSRAFLVKRYSGQPYVMYYIGLGLIAFFMTCGAGFIFVKDPKSVAAADMKDGKWTRLGASRTLRARVVVNVAQGMIILGLASWVAWRHYHARFGGRHDLRGLIAAVIAFAWGLLFFFFAGRAWMTGKAVSDARVLLEADELRPGRAARLRVQQDVSDGVLVEELKVGLVCTKTTGSGKHASMSKQWEWSHARPNPRPAAQRASGSLLASRLGLGGAESRPTITLETTIPIPPEQPATRPAPANPSFAWKLSVETRIANCPDYKVDFDVTVLPAE